MSERLDFYQEQAQGCVSSMPWLRQLQQDALNEFKRLGFPTRHHEDWKYTLLDGLLKQSFDSKTDGSPATITTAVDLPMGDVLTIANGHVLDVDAVTAHLPPGVIVCSMSDAMRDHADKLKPYLSHILELKHAFQALNTAMLGHGLFIYVPAGVCLTRPIAIRHWQDKANQAVHLRHLIVLEAGSSMTLIEDYQGDDSVSYLTNTITEVNLEAHAKLCHYKIQRESKQAFHIGHVAVKQAAESEFNSHLFSVGAKLVRSDIHIALDEPKARCLMNGVYRPTEGQHMDHHTLVSHHAPACTSHQDYKGILEGHSRAVFNGRVVVAKDAQHTEAKQQNKNLLLSKNTEIDTKPQLEIFADDVVCTHGATVGQLDEEALFYLATRGIDKQEATRYLVQAFTIDNLRMLPDPQMAEWVAPLLT